MQLTPLLDTTAVHLVVNADELLAAVDDGPPLIGLFNDDTMPFAVDTYDGVPTLTVMTTTAIRFLEEDPEGFFLMVEGARIDLSSVAEEGPARAARGRHLQRVVAREGPYRLQGEWWATGFEREYWLVRTAEGAVLWLFRSQGEWHVQAYVD